MSNETNPNSEDGKDGLSTKAQPGPQPEGMGLEQRKISPCAGARLWRSPAAALAKSESSEHFEIVPVFEALRLGYATAALAVLACFGKLHFNAATIRFFDGT